MNLHRLKKHQRKIVQQRADALAEVERVTTELAAVRHERDSSRTSMEELQLALQRERESLLAKVEQASTREKALVEERDAALARARKLEASDVLPDVKKLRERLRLKSELVDDLRRQVRQQAELLQQAGAALQHANRDMKLLGRHPPAEQPAERRIITPDEYAKAMP